MKRLLTGLVLIASAVTLGGCESYIYGEAPSVRTAPKASAKTQASKPAAAAKKAAAAQADLANADANPGEVVVKKGETLYGIARAHKVALRDLITVNRLAPPYELKAGQHLILPKQRVHEVRRGDTIYGISRRYGVTMSELARINRLAPTSPIKVGQKLRLPASIRPQSSMAALPMSVSPQTQRQTSLQKSVPKSGVSTAELPPPLEKDQQALGDAPNGRQNITAPDLAPPANVQKAPDAAIASKGPMTYPKPAPRT
ncbi:MAG: LysM peptidoglycan-binding domain-containing protein, partial [Rhodospirillaceae bacterium]|nr:LysM peptidoglycan-binding domain-containing protein [Rhodospirillaceae bacterium]